MSYMSWSNHIIWIESVVGNIVRLNDGKGHSHNYFGQFEDHDYCQDCSLTLELQFTLKTVQK